MTHKIKMLVVALSITLLGIAGLGNAGSKIPLVFNYDLPYNPWEYSKHSVTFSHSAHAMTYKISCIECHHTLDEDSAMVEESCQDCHGNPEMRSFAQAARIPAEERIDYYLLTIHDKCLKCHKQVRQSDQWTDAPVGCWLCHVYENK